MSVKLARWYGIIAALWMLGVSGGAIARETDIAALDAYLGQAQQAGLLNGNVLIADHGKVVLRRAIGYADASRTLPLTLSDRFDIGSIAKEFDAVGILMLAEDGRLSLTDPVSKFIPDLPAWSATVTLNDLLHYTSGLPDIDWNTVNSDADNFRNLRALKVLDFPSGTHYAYNNNNTFLRRRVIEKVSGMTYSAFLEKRVFPKAGIRDAVIDPTDGVPQVAKGFDAHFKQDPLKVYLTGWPAVTVDDFWRWSNCVTTFCLISPESTRQILATPNPKWQTGLGHGEMKGDQLVRHMHDGNDHNFQALLMVNPLKGRTIILVTSQNRDDVYAIATAINAILDGEPYQPLSAKATIQH
jgi:D-alanyl-D-alanine carboxypeptidase